MERERGGDVGGKRQRDKMKRGRSNYLNIMEDMNR